MADTIIIKHKFTANTVTTTVKLPGMAPISKQWRRRKGGFIGNFALDWADEPDMPAEVAIAADLPNTGVCNEMKR